MTKLQNRVKIAITAAAAVSILVSGCASSVSEQPQTINSGYVAATSEIAFGAAAHVSHASSIAEFIPVLAAQLRRYNEAATELWPDNAVAGKSVIIDDIEIGQLWSIAPDGSIRDMTDADVEALGVARMDTVGAFQPYDGGMYITVSEADLNDEARWGKYIHLGTYDAILWLIHEGFHIWEQPKWAETNDEVLNADREEFLDNTAARALRRQMQLQLLAAIQHPDNSQLILDALATYEQWKAEFPQEYQLSYYFDRIEGTAYYYEIVAALFAAHPNQIPTVADLDNALSALAARGEEVNSAYGLGLVQEGYTTGGYAGILLDRLDNNWKSELMKEPDLTPIELLRRQFAEATLPAPREVTADDMAQMDQRITEQYIFLLQRKQENIGELETLLVDLPAEMREMFIAEVQADIDNLQLLIAERQS